MGLITNPSLVATNTFGLSLSLWVRFPSLADITAAMVGVPPFLLEIPLLMVSIPAGGVVMFLIRSTDGNLKSWELDISTDDSVAGSTFWQSKQLGTFGLPPGPSLFLFDEWNHFFCAVNTQPSGISPNFKVGRMYLNNASINILPSAAPAVDSGTISYRMLLSGKEVTIPGTAAFRVAHPPFWDAFNVNIEMYRLQMFGSFIDPTNSANLSQFIIPSPDPSRTWDPAPAFPALSFGAPIIALTGGKDHFIINQGSGGPFTLTGTSSDYTPPPGSLSALGPGV